LVVIEGTAESNVESAPVYTHVIILIHGILTRAFWYDTAVPVLSTIKNVDVRPIGYGDFNLFRFLFPFLTRRGPQQRIAKQLRALKWEFDKKEQSYKLSVIAHSFGTYTIAAILESEDDIDLYNLILCGSVLPVDFDISQTEGGKFLGQ
jgi:hypothetical protein